MEKRRLGRSDLKVAPLAFGGNVFGWTVDETTSFALLDGFVAAGFNLIDTADAYSRWVPGHSGGESEAIIGQWMKARGNRDKVVIATKVGMEMAPGEKGLSAARIARAVEASLQRLQTDYIDLYQAHFDDPETPLAETAEAFARLVAQGKVRVLGASNYAGARLAAALAAQKSRPRYESFQPGYNLYDRAFETEALPVCLKEDIGVIPYFSLAAGFLTGKYRTEADFKKSVRGGGMAKYLNPRGLRILKALDDISAGYNAKPGQVALAWLMQRPGITAPIASATSLAQLGELVTSANLKLDAAAVAALDQASASE